MKNRLPAFVVVLPYLAAAAIVLALLLVEHEPAAQAQRPAPSDFEVVDQEPGSAFVSVVGNDRLKVLFRPTAITRVEVFAPKRAPDRYPWHVVYLHFGAAQFRVDCKTLDDAEAVVDLIDRNTPKPKG